MSFSLSAWTMCSSLCLRSEMSTMTDRTMTPWSVSIGLRPISTGNSLPSFLSANRSRPAPIGRDCGAKKNDRRIWLPCHPPPKDLLASPALRDSDDGGQDHDPLVGLDRIEADLDRKLAAVLAERIEVAASAQPARAGFGEECLSHTGMAAAEPLRHKHIHQLPQKLRARVPEHPLGLGVDHLDHASLVDHDHGIRRPFHHLAETLGTLPECPFLLLALGSSGPAGSDPHAFRP